MPGPWKKPQPAVKAAIAVLRAELTGIGVGYSLPSVRPAKFVQVSRIGGSRNVKQDIARILVECWTGSQADCETLAADASTALFNAAGKFTGTTFVYNYGDQQGPQDYPDPDVTDMHRWQFHGDFTVSI